MMQRDSLRAIEVTYNHPPEVFIARHIQALRATDFSLRVVARHQAENYKAIASVGADTADLSVLILPNFDHLSLFQRLLSLRYMLSAQQLPNRQRPLRDQVLLAFFRNLKPDLIHFHATGLAAMMRWIPQTLGIPYTVSLRGSDVQVFPLRSPREAQEARDALLGATRIHTVCRNLGETAERIVGAPLKFDTIYTTAPMLDSLPPYAPDPFSDLHFVSVGRLHWHKAFADLLVAFADLHSRNVGARLTIVGNGPDQARLQYWIERLGLASHVTLTGKLGADEIRALLSSAHAYVQSSIAEGFSNAVAEAMAWGCPVFATDVGGTSEIIRDGENGFLLAPFQPQAWANKLALARDVGLMNRVRAHAYATACQRFAPSIHAEQFIRFYEQALDNKKIPKPQNVIASNAKQSPAPNGRLPQTEIAHPAPPREILIVGRLEWSSGADQVLRALAQLARMDSTLARELQSFRIVLLGAGEQADELRYLAQALGFSPLEIISSAQFEDLLAEDERPRDVIIRLPSDTCGFWNISTNNGREAQASFGNFNELVAALCQPIKTFEVLPAKDCAQ